MIAANLAAEALLHDAGHFDFDYVRNVIQFESEKIQLSPHESDILRVLLNNRARPLPAGDLIQKVYGINEPDTAANSIRVAIHSLRKKIKPTGMAIKVVPKLGYEIHAEQVPELNRRLGDKILLALNHARASGDQDIARLLQDAMNLAETRRSKWTDMHRKDLHPKDLGPANLNRLPF